MNPGEKPRPPLPHGPFLVVGLARSGAAIAGVLAERGETVFGADSGTPEEAAGLEASGVEISLGVDGTRQLDRARTVVKSPGVPQDAPVVSAARERGLEVTGELELAWRLIPNAFCAVTGTNGKTTTTELVGHLYRTAGQPVAVAGNVGTPLASLVDAVDRDATVACEASSFQLEDTSYFGPECGGLPQPGSGPPRPPRDPREVPGGEAADLRQSGQRRLRRLQRPDAGAPWPRSRRLRAPGPLLPGRIAGGGSRTASSACATA